MQTKRSWTSQEDQVLTRIVESIENQTSNNCMEWQLVSHRLRITIQVYKTPKQCNDRWNNHLKPGSSKDSELTFEEQIQLFEMQQEMGNKWTIIAHKMGNRKDSAVKNYFYATLRKSIRIINNFVCQNRNEEFYKNFKTYPQNCIAKIIAQDQQKKINKMKVTKDNIHQAAREIKSLLLEISRGCSSRDLIQDAIFKISEFNRNCRRLRSKKRKACQQQQTEQHQSSKQTKSIKKYQNVRDEQEEMISMENQKRETKSQEGQDDSPLHIPKHLQEMIFKERHSFMEGYLVNKGQNSKPIASYEYDCDENMILDAQQSTKAKKFGKLVSISTKVFDCEEGFLLPNPLKKMQQYQNMNNCMGVIQRIRKCPQIYLHSEQMPMSTEQQFDEWMLSEQGYYEQF